MSAFTEGLSHELNSQGALMQLSDLVEMTALILIITHLTSGCSRTLTSFLTRLRRFIFMMTMSLVMNNPEFVVKNMKKIRSIMKLCAKLSRILIGMAHKGQAYRCT
ncbi:hypothetical protein PMSM_13245 [Paenibacillus macquariensis subsp. macquariensis]|uniref:Uncharacterized protein n=1 Tax=Paenibacillus macquariensis TaxID=948756 RepID=A0ABY1KGL3_9BACL|nr:hypothetical protein [Paenibacillus macquariensis]OAB34303.1 hypothetical protein PMSM_13245 [Paenibacillus macquariensis subsp. macquariensis]SIR67916.1 hypothetical protein SAMN05421578_1322 [Paenibacillus macquariensis]